MPNVHPWHIRRALREARRKSNERALLDQASAEVREIVGEGFANAPLPKTDNPEAAHNAAETRQHALTLARYERRFR